MLEVLLFLKNEPGLCIFLLALALCFRPVRCSIEITNKKESTE